MVTRRWWPWLTMALCLAVGVYALLRWHGERFPFGPGEARRRQRAAARALGRSVEQTIDLGGAVMLTLVLIPAGRFQMGYGGSQEWVTITEPFYLGKYEVTQAQYQTLVGHNPSRFKGLDRPVEYVSWDDAQRFCRKLSELHGVVYRLPTEAEWEYACRAGSAARYCFGEDKARLGEYAWFDRNSGGQTHAVGQKRPNAWGLYDVHGNVREWCRRLGRGCSSAFRGGSWCEDAFGCDCALMCCTGASVRRSVYGFRVARPLP